MDGTAKVAIEVRTTTGGQDPMDAIDESKRRRVQRLAVAIGADRTDFIGVGLGRAAFVVHRV